VPHSYRQWWIRRQFDFTGIDMCCNILAGLTRFCNGNFERMADTYALLLLSYYFLAKNSI
jgi:hypothetical protein